MFDGVVEAIGSRVCINELAKGLVGSGFSDTISGQQPGPARLQSCQLFRGSHDWR